MPSRLASNCKHNQFKLQNIQSKRSVSIYMPATHSKNGPRSSKRLLTHCSEQIFLHTIVERKRINLIIHVLSTETRAKCMEIITHKRIIKALNGYHFSRPIKMNLSIVYGGCEEWHLCTVVLRTVRLENNASFCCSLILGTFIHLPPILWESQVYSKVFIAHPY